MIKGQQRCYGFTLAELSVVLIIIATLTGMSISATIPILQQAKINATTAKMNAIEKALLNYSVANGRIPCPADLTLTQSNANYGLEAGATSGGVGTGECVTGMTPAANFRASSGVAEGGLPVAALGLPNDFIYDSWGHKFRYVVDPTYTIMTSFASRPFPNNLCTTSQSTITINNTNGGTRSSTAVYALISHGANGHGAYTSSGVPFNAGSLNTDELTNCHCDNTGAHTGGAGILSSPTYVQKAPAYQTGQANQPLYYFDDIVTYKEAWQMLTASNPAPATCPAIWVADDSNNRVLKLDTNGNFLQGFGASYNGVSGSVGSSGSSDGQLNGPSSAIVDASGNLWVADNGNNRIVELNSSGQWLMSIGGKTTDACGGTYISATACNPLPASTDGGVSRAAGTTCCAPNAASCTCSGGNANGQLNVAGTPWAPQQIAFDTSGNLWTTDYHNNRVQEFNSSTGAFITQFAVGSCPSGLIIDNNNILWVSSDCSNHVQKCTTSGSCITFNPPTLGSNWASNYVTVDPNSGNIWANDQGGTVYEFNSSGTYLGSLSNTHTTNLEGIFYDSTGYLWIADDNAHDIYKINPATGNLLKTIGTGSSGTGTNPVQFHNPQDIFISTQSASFR